MRYGYVRNSRRAAVACLPACLPDAACCYAAPDPPELTVGLLLLLRTAQLVLTVRAGSCRGLQWAVSTEPVRRARLFLVRNERPLYCSTARGAARGGERESRLRTFETAFVPTVRTQTHAGGEKHPTVLVQNVRRILVL
jgi:hypothetical protein